VRCISLLGDGLEGPSDSVAALGKKVANNRPSLHTDRPRAVTNYEWNN